MENKLPTAEEVRKMVAKRHGYENLVIGHRVSLFHESMIEFAKLHVKAALESAADKLPYDDKLNQDILLKQEILNAYPENLIK